MPARPDQKRGNGGLTGAQTRRIEDIVIRGGYGIGVTALHHKLRLEMGADAPTREEIGAWKRAIPSEQVTQMPKATAGVKNVISPVIPPAYPMSRVFANTYFYQHRITRKSARAGFTRPGYHIAMLSLNLHT